MKRLTIAIFSLILISITAFTSRSQEDCMIITADKKEEYIEDLGIIDCEGKASYPGDSMPCENPKLFKQWLESQEIKNESSNRTEQINDLALYAVNGNTLAPDVQEYLYNKLDEMGISWFYEYALLIAYQESRFDFDIISFDGKDHGLFQYRLQFWQDNLTMNGLDINSDIYDPYAQIDLFCMQMAARAKWGCDVATMISRHNMSDWGAYNQDYVNQVMRWESSLERMK